MCAINLSHRKLDFHWFACFGHNEIPSMIMNPLSRFLQVTFFCCFLAIWSWNLESHGFFIPTVNMLWIANSTPKPLMGTPQLESEKKTVWSCWERKINLSINFKPPYLLEIRNRAKSAWKNEFQLIILHFKIWNAPNVCNKWNRRSTNKHSGGTKWGS